jgi:single-stranded-DNA-specific exonuclease
MEVAVDRIKSALERGERIAVFGDFDVDGVTATALLARALKPLGSQILPYIPHRVEEGHGLSLRVVERLTREGVDLLITVDCGVTSYEEVRAASRAGIDTIITDHHLAPDGGPDACAVVDPRLNGSHYPFPYLTGAGLAWKLAQAVYASLGRAAELEGQPLMSLAALGTIADVGPLVDENRSIVRGGLQELGRRPTPGLSALMRSARQDGHPPDTETVGWYLAHRLNAAGRVGHADTSYRLLVTDSPEEAAGLVGTLETQNRQRQELTAAAQEKAKGLVELEPLIMVGDASFLPGIIGLVASRLVDEFGRPAVVVSVDGEVSLGI